MTTQKLSEIEKLRISMDSKFADVDEKFEEVDKNFKKIDNKLDTVLNQLDSIVGQFKKFDEERVLISDKVKEHTDDIEELQSVVFAN